MKLVELGASRMGTYTGNELAFFGQTYSCHQAREFQLELQTGEHELVSRIKIYLDAQIKLDTTPV